MTFSVCQQFTFYSLLFTCYFTAQYTSDLAMERPAQYEELMKNNLVEPLNIKTEYIIRA